MKRKVSFLFTMAVLVLTSLTANAEMYIFFGGMNYGEQKQMVEEAPGVYTYTYAESGGYNRFFFTTTDSDNWNEICANRYGSGEGHDIPIYIDEPLPVVKDQTGTGCYSYYNFGRLSTITYDTNAGTVKIGLSPLYIWDTQKQVCHKMDDGIYGEFVYTANFTGNSYFVFTTKGGKWEDVKDDYRIASGTGDNYTVTANTAAPAVKDNTGYGGYHFNGDGILYTITYYPKTQQIKVVPAQEQDMYLYGSFDWAAGKQRKMAQNAPGVFTATAPFAAMGDFYLTQSASSNKDIIDSYRYGPADEDATGSYKQLTLGVPTSATLIPKGKANKYQFTEAGIYTITYNANKGTLVAERSSKKKMYFFTSLDSWAAGKQRPMTEVAPGVFKYTFTVTDGAAFYFTEADAPHKDIIDQFRYGAGSDVTMAMGVAENCVKVAAGSGAYYVQGAGTYTVTFDTNTGKVLAMTGSDMYIRLVNNTDLSLTYLDKMTETAPNVFTHTITLDGAQNQRFNFYTSSAAYDTQRYGGNTGSDVTVTTGTEYNVVKDTHTAGCYSFTSSESIPFTYTITYDANRGKLTITPSVSQKMYVYTKSAMDHNGYSQEMTETAPGVFRITGNFADWFYLTNVYSNDKNQIDKYRYAAGQGVESMIALDEVMPAVRIDVSRGTYGKYNFQQGVAGNFTITYDANNHTVVVTMPYEAGKQFDYGSKTYTWYDADGNEHTSSLTDKATDPFQMQALLTKVYTDPTIPGSRNVDGEDGDDFIYNDDYERLPYFGDSFIPQPVEGFTALLVELKDKASETDEQHIPYSYQDFDKNIKSIQLISNVTESTDAYVMSISGSFDRFYIIGKGKARYALPQEGKTSAIPSSAGFERLSLTGNGNVAGSPDLYPRLVAGESYRITHDCADLPYLGHYMLINPGEGNDPYLKNITLYVPKDRMRYWDENTPWVDENGVTHDGGFVWPESSGVSRDSNGKHTWYNPNTCPQLALYQAKLQGNVGNPNNGKCNVNLDWTSTLKNSFNWDGGETYEVYIVLPDGTRQLLTMQNDDTDYSYLVDQQEQSYTIQYEVVCYPTDSKNNKVGPAVTNVVTLTIPGTGDDFKITYFYRSRFNVSSLLNSYKNRIELTPYNFTAPTEGELTRKVMRMKQDGSDVKEIATITIHADESFAIAYNNAMATNANWRYDKNALETSGSIADNGKIFIADYFLASTEQGGDLAGSYIYYVAGGRQTAKAEVPVYSSNINSSYINEYTIDMLNNDTDRSLLLNDMAQVSFDNKSNDAKYNEVNSWDIYQDNEIKFQATRMAKAPLQGSSLTNYTGQLTVNSQHGINTYGTNTTQVQGAVINITADGGWTEFNNIHLYPQGGMYAYEGKVTISPSTATTVAPYVYYYRLWRVEDGEETLINTLPENAGNGWGTNYGEIKGFYPAGNATSSTTLQRVIDDIYVKEAVAEGSEKNVTYIVRMYTTPTPSDNEIGNNVKRKEGPVVNVQKIYINEAQVAITYDDTKRITTGVNDVVGEKSVSSTTYYNLMGISSDKPFSGVNIKVTRYTDGSITKSKMMK